MIPAKHLLLFILPALLFTSCSDNNKTSPGSGNENRLRVSGDQIVNQKGDTVCLRGFGLGGMLHMENFIDGYASNEETMREGLRAVLGEKKYNLYFDTFLKSYFTEPDAAYIQHLGLNLVRIPINYHLFEDDMNPGVIKEGAFAYLDSVIARCARHHIYTIIDLHALPGAQNQHWHSDNPTHVASFWIHKEFQDRALHLWEVIAQRYVNEPWVAGYDLINEPAEPTGEKLFPYYKRLRDAIRKIDANHILFLEGDSYAADFSKFTEVWDNVVYANHDYASPGFGGEYPGYNNNRYYTRDTIEKDFLAKSQFMISHHAPIWVGEFGPVYTGDPQKDEVRYQVLKDQLAYYHKYKVSWCIWLYKDLGLQAIMYQDKSTPYRKLISKFLARKDSLGADAWGSNDKNIRQVIDPLEQLFAKEFPAYNPYPKGQKREIALLVRHILIADALVPEYCNLFKGLSDEQLTALAQSFGFKNYVKRTRLENILTGREK
ncbi:glycoside hydrolase family 5 protein [Mucilaginibacter sp. PPCGB 2223]|uniref:glycoside hydrolase family 5 protein n=1 Tax=Mucilaginibacter sp. PPCGB 2223 TaxID=1886027 RepID=UPI0009F4E2B7|nr:cellulase family glycosylhydrolase [Mucilaginibacter sp. PPCGB 2223]